MAGRSERWNISASTADGFFSVSCLTVLSSKRFCGNFIPLTVTCWVLQVQVQWHNISSRLFFQALLAGKNKILSLKFSMQRIISSNWYPGHERLVAPNAFSLIIVVSWGLFIYLAGDLHLADDNEISFFPLYWQERVTFWHFADSSDPGSINFVF